MVMYSLTFFILHVKKCDSFLLWYMFFESYFVLFIEDRIGQTVIYWMQVLFVLICVLVHFVGFYASWWILCFLTNMAASDNFSPVFSAGELFLFLGWFQIRFWQLSVFLTFVNLFIKPSNLFSVSICPFWAFSFRKWF